MTEWVYKPRKDAHLVPPVTPGPIVPTQHTSTLTVYITDPSAPLCRRVCEFLDRRGYAYTTIEVATDSDRAVMLRRTGHATCPLVLAGDEVIGKLEETIAADRAGRLGARVDQAAVASDIEQLTALNAEYIHSDQFRDVDRYQELLAGDYRATLPDLAFRDKTQFLRMLSDAPRPFTDLQAHDLEIRILGDVALIHGRVTFNQLDGTPGRARYTDTWARRDGRWLCVAADVIAPEA
jgi:glutaredoxin/ketosteroid isomerase-like protein